MFDTHPYRNLLTVTAVTIFGTLFNLSVVLLEEPPAIFGWMFGVLTGAMWVMFGVLLNSFLHRNKVHD